jgi:hypothetical protein
MSVQGLRHGRPRGTADTPASICPILPYMVLLRTSDLGLCHVPCTCTPSPGSGPFGLVLYFSSRRPVLFLLSDEETAGEGVGGKGHAAVGILHNCVNGQCYSL